MVTPHQRELKKISRLQRVTLLKYIHGWLATNKRRSKEGGQALAHCIYCGEVEDRQHLFTCKTPQWQRIQNLQWQKLTLEVLSQTDPSFAAIFCQGLETVRGKPPADERTMAEWPSSLRTAYEIQVQIGWEQVFYGRLAVQLEVLTNFKGQSMENTEATPWTSQAIQKCWKFGLELWTACNQMVHGNMGGPSLRDQTRAEAIIRVMFRDLRPIVTYRLKEVFDRTEDKMLHIPYQNQVAWIERIKLLYPQDYRNLTEKVDDLQTELETKIRGQKWPIDTDDIR